VDIDGIKVSIGACNFLSDLSIVNGKDDATLDGIAIDVAGDAG